MWVIERLAGGLPISVAEASSILCHPALTVAPGTTEAAQAHIAPLSERIRLANRQLKDVTRRVDALANQLQPIPVAEQPWRKSTYPNARGLLREGDPPPIGERAQSLSYFMVALNARSGTEMVVGIARRIRNGLHLARDAICWAAGRVAGINIPRPVVLELATVYASGLFDPDYYRRTHPEGAPPGDPLLNYLRESPQCGSRPHPLFDPKTYLTLHPDVAEAAVQPLIHFVRHGVAERRDPDPCFPIAAYIKDHPEIIGTPIHPLHHWARQAVDPEGRKPPRLYHAAPLLLDLCAKHSAVTFVASWDPGDPAQSAPTRDLALMNSASREGLNVRLLLHRARLTPHAVSRVREMIDNAVEICGLEDDGLICHAADTFIACSLGDATRAAGNVARNSGNNILLADDLESARDLPKGWTLALRSGDWAWSEFAEALAAAEGRQLELWPMRSRTLGYRVLKSPEFTRGRICLFSHFDVDCILDPHVQTYIRALTDAGIATWLITSCDGLELESLELARSLCAAVIIRENRGYDFAGWAMVLDAWPELFDADELIFANDSVYGPIIPLQHVFSAMATVDCDLWGMTSSREIAPHMQSYFLVFRKAALAHEVAKSFWGEVRPLPSKEGVITRYELRLEKVMRAAGLRTAVYAPPLDKLASNPTSKHWRELVAKHAFPFVKVSLLRDNPNREDISGWDLLVARGGYEASLIDNHLKRVKPSAPGLRARDCGI
jgi:hypothetical protein